MYHNHEILAICRLTQRQNANEVRTRGEKERRVEKGYSAKTPNKRGEIIKK